MAELKIMAEKPDSRLTVLRLSGEFEGAAVLDSQDELFRLLSESVGSDFMMDLAEIAYVDSAAIGVLLQMAKIASGKKMRFGLLHANENIKKVLAVTKVNKILTTYDS